MDDFTATGLAEGFIEADSEDQIIEAWQHLHDTGLAYRLPPAGLVRPHGAEPDRAGHHLGVTDMTDIRRAWINQPSTHDPLHTLHGTKVLAAPDTPGTYRVYFLDGPIFSQQVPKNALSFSNWGY